jgi:CheY-like chemotaxis protein
LNIDSRVGEGTTFAFIVPVRRTSTLAAPAVSPERWRKGPAAGQPHRRILVADDMPEGRQLLARLLTPMGFEVKEAADGRAAVALWETWQPQLVCMDMRMPEMDGKEATRAIRAKEDGRHTVIVALTASSFEEDRAEIMAAGCDDFLRKPFREEALLELIHRYLRLEYADDDGEAQEPAAISPAAQIAALPAALRERLDVALQRLDTEAITAAIAAIRAQDAAAAALLAAQAENFRYGEMRAMLAVQA